MENFKLIAFTVPDFFIGEEKIISELFARNLEILHLRKPNFSIQNLSAIIEKIPNEFHSRIVIHNNFELSKDFDLQGIHLTEQQKNNFQNLEHTYKIVSTSCHSLDDIATNQNFYEYLFLSPIFDSISKQNHNSKFSTDELLAAKNKQIITKKIIALGGIELNNIKSIFDFGFGGVGVLGTLWNKFNSLDAILNKFTLLKNEIKNVEKEK